MFELLRKDLIEEREYQINIVNSVLKNGNSLVILPTGLGKTIIALYVLADALQKGKRVMMLAPTKPLATQHYEEIKKFLKVSEGEVALLTGKVRKEKRIEEEKKKIIVATPQTIVNDIKNGHFYTGDFGVVVFDEAHKAVGNYAYTYIANECISKKIKILGLTASPGGEKSKINQLIKTLAIENIEIRSREDKDVVKYIKQLQIKLVKVELNVEVKEIMKGLEELLEEKREKLNNTGVVKVRSIKSLTKKEILSLGNEIFSIKSNARFGIIPLYTSFLNLMHAYELIQSQGIGAFLDYFEKKEKEENQSKGLKNLLKDERLAKIIAYAKQAMAQGKEHPKLNELLRIIKERSSKTIIVFAQYRSQIARIVEMLNKNGIKAKAFVGKKEGITQEQQEKIIKEFRNGEFNVLVATSIGEEGLDIPSVDTVIFYEPVPSEIRSIQRKGRAGRTKAGEVIVLIAKGTRDEGYFFASSRKEIKMKRIIEEMKDKKEGKKKRREIQKKIFSFLSGNDEDKNTT
ncbi:MAG: helicase-related protein [Candidatus Micrarchaeales archaeon]